MQISYYKIMDEKFYNIYNSGEILERKKLGEVYTPEEIAIKMINKIPENIWQNKNIKVLDFACGAGVFSFHIYKKLIQYFDNDYILNNILYFNDIQEKNINKIKYIFGNPKNIYHGDFLKWDCCIKFDVIIGNPPFQAHNNRKSNGNSIWHKFVDKLLYMLAEGGYLSLIHPAGWRKPATDKCKYTHLYKKLTQERQMHYLEIHNTNDGKITFNCGTRYDIYVVENVIPYKNTLIVDELNISNYINLLEWPFVPNHSFQLIAELLNCDGNNVKIIYNRSNYGSEKKYIRSFPDEIYKYKVIHTTTKKGIKYKYSSRNDLGHFGIKKLIWCVSNFVVNIIDIKGEYGMTQLCVAIEIKDLDEGKMLKKCFMSKKFNNFMSSMNYSNYSYEFRVFNYLKDGIWKVFNE